MAQCSVTGNFHCHKRCCLTTARKTRSKYVKQFDRHQRKNIIKQIIYHMLLGHMQRKQKISCRISKEQNYFHWAMRLKLWAAFNPDWLIMKPIPVQFPSLCRPIHYFYLFRKYTRFFSEINSFDTLCISVFSWLFRVKRKINLWQPLVVVGHFFIPTSMWDQW